MNRRLQTTHISLCSYRKSVDFTLIRDSYSEGTTRCNQYRHPFGYSSGHGRKGAARRRVASVAVQLSKPTWTDRIINLAIVIILLFSLFLLSKIKYHTLSFLRDSTWSTTAQLPSVVTHPNLRQDADSTRSRLEVPGTQRHV
jgi:hypothetical protein